MRLSTRTDLLQILLPLLKHGDPAVSERAHRAVELLTQTPSKTNKAGQPADLMHSMYPWDKAPDWALWASTDDNGRARWWAGKPTYCGPTIFGGGFWVAEVPSDRYAEIPAELLTQGGAHSLQSHPDRVASVEEVAL